MSGEQQVLAGYEYAREVYADVGVDTELALRRLSAIQLSLPCWQGDDVTGFEGRGVLGGGLAATGGYPGRARNADELRADLDLAFSLIPGRHRLNLHAIYAETGGRKVERNELLPEHFAVWVEWAEARGHGLDFNPTCFSHPLADGGFTLSSSDPAVRRFWIEHCQRSRLIGEYFGRRLGTPCVTNIWIPDGMKDTPADRATPRLLLKESLDEIFARRIDPRYNLDAVEGKLFGLGSESFVVGSYDFYLGYALANRLLLCLDTGHFHPTESVADKLSSLMPYVDGLLLHLSRGVRWDSDHVVVASDELYLLAEEIVRGGYLDRVHLALDYFDASINRVAAWVVGARSTLKAFLFALLEPIDGLRAAERTGDYTRRLVLAEEAKDLPFGAVWAYHCLQQGVPAGADCLKEIEAYEERVLAKRR